MRGRVCYDALARYVFLKQRVTTDVGGWPRVNRACGLARTGYVRETGTFGRMLFFMCRVTGPARVTPSALTALTACETGLTVHRASVLTYDVCLCLGGWVVRNYAVELLCDYCVVLSQLLGIKANVLPSEFSGEV